jgi:protease-4
MAKTNRATAAEKNPWGLIIGLLLIFFLMGFVFIGIISALIGGVDEQSGNVAVIPVKGTIMTEGSNDLFSSASIASSTQIVADIEDASNDPEIKAIIFEIDSPGGAPVASDEIVQAIKNSNKTTVAWIRETGASGAYWIASATDYIVANKLSITGSIGVLESYLEFSGLMDHYNVTYERMNGGNTRIWVLHSGAYS